jgi:hypothetical protein
MTKLAGRGAAWGSALSAGEFAAVRSVGFEPVGQAFGAAVYPLFATEAVSCPGPGVPSVVPFTCELSGPDFAKLLMDGW